MGFERATCLLSVVFVKTRGSFGAFVTLYRICYKHGAPSERDLVQLKLICIRTTGQKREAICALGFEK